MRYLWRQQRYIQGHKKGTEDVTTMEYRACPGAASHFIARNFFHCEISRTKLIPFQRYCSFVSLHSFFALRD